MEQPVVVCTHFFPVGAEIYGRVVTGLHCVQLGLSLYVCMCIYIYVQLGLSLYACIYIYTHTEMRGGGELGGGGCSLLDVWVGIHFRVLTLSTFLKSSAGCDCHLVCRRNKCM